MKIISWLRKIAGSYTDDGVRPMAEGTHCVLKTEKSDPVGTVLCHDRETRDGFLAEFARDKASRHYGVLSSSIIDQLGPAASSIWASVRAGRLVQIVGDPLQGGSREFVQAAVGFTGTVRDVASKRFVEQARFVYASRAPIIAPVMAIQVIHVLAGVQQMHSIDQRLAHLQRIVEEIVFRQQATLCGKLWAAIECLDDLEAEYTVTEYFSDDMTMRLAIVERDVRTVVAEQQAVIDRFHERSEKLLSEAKGRKSLIEVNDLIRESGDTYLCDAVIAVAAARAQFMVKRAWLIHDLEHVPGYVQARVDEIGREINTCTEVVQQLDAVDRLRDHAVECTKNMKHFEKFLYWRIVKSTVRQELPASEPDAVVSPMIPSWLVWQDETGQTKVVSVGISTTDSLPT